MRRDRPVGAAAGGLLDARLDCEGEEGVAGGGPGRLDWEGPGRLDGGGSGPSCALDGAGFGGG